MLHEYYADIIKFDYAPVQVVLRKKVAFLSLLTSNSNKK